MIDHMIFAPHHDDAEFGLGGALQKWLAAGESVFVMVCTVGDYVRVDGRPVCTLQRRAETASAMEKLGVTEWDIWGAMIENQGPHAPYVQIVSGLENFIKRHQPRNVYVCMPSFNQDHRVLHDAMVTAFRPAKDLPNLYAFTYPGSCWGVTLPAWGRRYISIDFEQLSRKREALDCHRSQFEGREVQVSPAAALTLARQYGIEAGVEYAELVYVMKEVV